MERHIRTATKFLILFSLRNIMTEQELFEIFDADEADLFALYVENLASKYEVTCDYIMEEFILSWYIVMP